MTHRRGENREIAAAVRCPERQGFLMTTPSGPRRRLAFAGAFGIIGP